MSRSFLCDEVIHCPALWAKTAACVMFQQNCYPDRGIGCFSVIHPNQLHEYGKTKQNNALWYPVWLPLVGQQLMENTLSEHYVLPENVLGLMDDVIGCQLNTFNFTRALKWVTLPYAFLGKQLCEDNAAQLIIPDKPDVTQYNINFMSSNWTTLSCSDKILL